MKKLLSVLLVAVMMLSLGVTAFAADDEPVLSGDDDIEAVVDDPDTDEEVENEASFNVEVPIEIDDMYVTTVKYKVVIEWTVTPTETDGKTHFTHIYSYVWNAENLSYEENEDKPETVDGKGNELAEVTITITNKSNVDIDYKVDYDYSTNSTAGFSVEETHGETEDTDPAKGTVATADTIDKLGDADSSGNIGLETKPDDDSTPSTDAPSKTYTGQLYIEDGVTYDADGTDGFNLEAKTVCLGKYTVTIGAKGAYTDNNA